MKLMARPSDEVNCPNTPQDSFLEIETSNSFYELMHELSDQDILNDEVFWNCKY